MTPRLRGRVAELKSRLSRARYFRGHGVHSPFVYAIVRQVFMSRRLQGGETALHDALLMAGVSARRALELQNLMIHCGYRTFVLSGHPTMECQPGTRRSESARGGGQAQDDGQDNCPGRIFEGAAAELCILLPGLPEPETLRLVREASGRGATVVVMAPYADAERERMCRAIVASHASTTVDNRGYLLIFNNKHLPKQHFRI